MVLYQPEWVPSKIPSTPVRDRRRASNVSFLVWATVVLVALAAISVAFGVAPVDAPFFAAR